MPVCVPQTRVFPAQDVFTPALVATPSQCWQRIIPQLFSRLSHPSTYVQQEVLELLCRLGRDVPHLIVYPAVVGSAGDEDNSTPAVLADASTTTPHARIMQSIIAHSPQLVEQIKDMMYELKRIIVLWEEQWCEALAERRLGIARRIVRLKDEAERVAGNDTLTAAEKHQVCWPSV